ncbi:hypothetical protein SBP02_02860 [Pseudomonas benzenivorans]|uniref:Lipoprotein n=1 Tax=Pseudomonas benzenivorans TaxID=556533 RepID=A0ABZ0PX38_9PSED|nr:hypothetical protein [Pseudomonas benzenivorans]WPC05717.1 hypothetical protein SBP02_02860 [Pseudomonas benzenivorans]
MRKITAVLISASCLFLTGCPQVSTVDSGYPAEITMIGESPNYPMEAAGFQRAEVIAYAPGMMHMSTAYNLRSPEVQVAATIYIVPHEAAVPDFSGRFDAEKSTIEDYHPGAILVEQEEVELVKNGKRYAARKAAYEFSGVFDFREQKLYSEVVLLSHKGSYVKLRSTSPAAQRAAARQKNMDLLEAVNWAY